MEVLFKRLTTSRKMMSIISCLLYLSLVLIFHGCNGDESEGGDGVAAASSASDSVAPVVTITAPTGDSIYTSNSTPLTISGIASDSGGVSSVVWSSGAGASGTCTGTTTWTAEIALIEGLNTITITAEDPSGNTGADSITVIYSLSTVTLSGTISVPFTNMLDSDVNDVNQSCTANDTIADAQTISNPVTLGGYVNEAYSGSYGRSYRIGDVDDYFKVSLSAGDTISLSISDYDSDSNRHVDLDLYIYDMDENVVASSVGDKGTESIADFDYSGTYYINVHAEEYAASNYVLSVGDQADSTAKGALASNKDFVAGQVIVRFRDGTTGIASMQTMSDRISDMGMEMKAGRPGKEALASLDISEKTAAFRTLGIPDDRAALTAMDTKTQKKLDTLLAIKALRKRSDVASADPNYIVHKVTVPNDPYYSYQWNLPLMNLPDAWDATTGNSSVIVAVVDTGVLLDHPDLSGKLTDGYDFISEASDSSDGDGIDDDPDDPGDQDNADGSSSFHGTHVAGIIAAETDNSTGVAGVTWNTSIMPVRVLGIGGGTSYDMLQGVRYAAGIENDSGIILDDDEKADIINLSLGADTWSETEEAVFNEVRDAGLIVISAAGNDASSKAFYPASYDGVISVGAVDINGDMASYSNYGPNVDVAAPGGDSGDLNGDGYPDYVLSACGDDLSGTVTFNYAFMAGTSMAAPHVAGVAALMKAIRPTMTPDEFDQYLESGEITYDIDDTETYGYGLIDAYKAVIAAEESAPSVIKVSPSSLNLGRSSTSAELSVSQLGSDTVSVTGVGDDAAWLTVSADDTVDENGLGAYYVVVDKTDLSDGNYSATITFYSTSNTAEVSVKMQVNTSGITPDAGYHYVLLVDPDNLDPVSYDYMEAENGIYEYSFTDVSQGTYEIYAGSDRDNDGYIGDRGESFGAYNSLDEPTKVIVGSDNIDGLDFTTDYLVTFSTAAGLSEDNSPRLLMKRIQKINKTVEFHSQGE